MASWALNKWMTVLLTDNTREAGQPVTNNRCCSSNESTPRSKSTVKVMERTQGLSMRGKSIIWWCLSFWPFDLKLDDDLAVKYFPTMMYYYGSAPQALAVGGKSEHMMWKLGAHHRLDLVLICTRCSSRTWPSTNLHLT